jgi:uncharacterized protein YneF (UPF0154 family)
MLNLAMSNIPTLAVALLIGVVTGFWAFRRPLAPAADGQARDEPGL